MKGLLLLLTVVLSGVILRQACGADAPILAVKGGSVEFKVQTNLEGIDIDYILWRFNLEHPVAKYSNESLQPVKKYKEYANRTAVDITTYSLILSDLTELDNGTYSARIMNHHGYDKDVALHRLVVHEGVPDLDFNMTLLYFNYTEGYCNVSITCSAEDSYVSYTCDFNSCTEDQMVLLKPHLVMSVSGTGGTVVCNASNLVSAKSHLARMSDMCVHASDTIEGGLIDGSAGWVYGFTFLLGPTLIVLDTVFPVLLICLILYFLLIRPKHTGDLRTMELKRKALSASVELLHVQEFEEVLKDPTLPDYLKGAATYSISRGRTPALPKRGLIQEQFLDTQTLVSL